MKKLYYYLIIGLLYLPALLPLRVLYALSDFMYLVVYRLLHYRIKVVRRNLRNAFPDRSEDEIERIERGFYHHLCDCIVETVKLLHISDREMMQRVELHNTELVEATGADGVPIILFLGHYGNWEWVPTIAMYVAQPHTLGTLYRPLKNEVMDRVMLRIRSRFRVEHIPMRSAYRQIVQLKSTGNPFMIGFIADQRPTGGGHHNWTEFLNQDTLYNVGGETIGNRIAARYVFLDVEKTHRGHYSMTFREMNPKPQDGEEYPYTIEYYRLLEENIRRAPEYWLWSHNRWKRKRR